MDKILADTNILIDYSKGKDDVLLDLLSKQRAGEVALIVNSVIVAEYFTDKNLKRNVLYKKAINFFRNFGVFEMTKKTGVLAGELLREVKVLTLGDALIAASAIEANLLLATRNKKRFRKVPKLKFYQL